MTTEYQIQQGLNKLSRNEKIFLLESLRKERQWFRDNRAWTPKNNWRVLTESELRRFNLVEKQIKLLELEVAE